MKRFLLLCALVPALVSSTSALAQCSIGIPNVTATNTYTTADSCYVKFNLNFAMKNNTGNKTIGIDLWQGASYARPPYDKAPSSTQLAAAFGSIVLDNTGANGSTLMSVSSYQSYPFGSNARILRTGAITKSYNETVDSFYFTITDIILGTSKLGDGSCPVSMLTLKGDVWSTNAGSLNANTTVQCVSGIASTLGNPTIPAGVRNCTSPRSLDFRIETTSPTNISVTYQIFKDDNVFTANNQRLLNTSSDANVTKNGAQTINNLSGATPFVGDDITFVNNDATNSNAAYWVVVYYTPAGGTTYSVSRLINNACALSILPVVYTSFTAERLKERVSLKWETASEINNRGFNVQRNTKGEWKNIAFVFSQSNSGLSTGSLAYGFRDVNTESGTTQYRIQQVDFEGKATISETRTVRGDGIKKDMTIFPNPSLYGQVNLVFNDKLAARNVFVTDMNGQLISQFLNVLTASLSLRLEKSGMYTIRATTLTGTVLCIEKVIVKKQ